MKNKKIISIFIMSTMIIATFVGCNSAQSSASGNSTVSSSKVDSDSNSFDEQIAGLTESSIDDFSFDTKDDGTKEIYSYEGTANIVNIPESDEGIEVTELGEILRGDTTVIEVNIPDTITHISSNAFQFCTSLEKLTFGKNVEKIGENLCLGDTSLKELTLSEALKAVPYGAFQDCALVEKVTLFDNVESIDLLAFYGCTSLKEIHMTDSVTFIADENDAERNVFDKCDNLTIYAPAGSYAEEYAKKKNIPFVAE